MGQQLLVERAPVRPDPHRLAVANGDFDDLAELQVTLRPEPDVARIYAVFVERLGAGRVVGEQLMADVMKVADQGNVHAHGQEAFADFRRRDGGLVPVDGQPHQLGAGAGEGRDLTRRRLDVRGVGVGHRLDDDRGAAADHDGRRSLADFDRDGLTASAGAGPRPGA